MKSILKYPFILLLTIVLFSFNKKIETKLTALHSYTDFPHTDKSQENPFEKFKGEWVLKDDIFETNFGDKYKEDVNPNRSFVVKELGTKNSVVWIEDFDGFKVDIFWTYDFKQKQVHHLSMSNDIAKGIGEFKESGDLEIKLIYENSCENCYRIYSFQWKSENELFFRGSFYKDEKPTGDFYGGTFIRKVQ